MYIIDTRSFRSLSLKICLTELIAHGVDPCRTQLSLLNRQFNKLLFLRNLKTLLQNRKLNLSAISKIFMKIQTVYKQAQIERDSIRKQKGPGKENCFKKDAFTADQFLAIDLLIIQLQRLGRLKANTSFHANAINAFLRESAPTNRVLSGESIIFQNDSQDLLKDLINQSECPLEVPKLPVANPLSTRYVTAVVCEFFRCILENHITI